jgi:hypothetical protein
MNISREAKVWATVCIMWALVCTFYLGDFAQDWFAKVLVDPNPRYWAMDVQRINFLLYSSLPGALALIKGWRAF